MSKPETDIVLRDLEEEVSNSMSTVIVVTPEPHQRNITALTIVHLTLLFFHTGDLFEFGIDLIVTHHKG